MPAHANLSPVIDEDALLREMTMPSANDEAVAPVEDERAPLAPVAEHLRVDAPTHAEAESLPIRSQHSDLAAIHDLERQAREWRVVARVAEHHLKQLVAAQDARDNAYRSLAEIAADVERTAEQLSEALNVYNKGDLSHDLDGVFEESGHVLAGLEKIVGELSVANALCRSAWQAHARSLRDEQNLRATIQGSQHG
jgi:hypothetical protein